ncbi:L-threonylcarbamoyladenylate synthase [Alkalicoccus chagannorensis]|uniref:L-threonylcarbamoyladenylate synthase n=1 Tax=Alkalicoccus chagannorensis TaxID=427072 RepID=UPI0003FE99FF|nr:L-threonylcarbamoyladenylate synthase [Alkalicoccus chagannorensis]
MSYAQTKVWTVDEHVDNLVDSPAIQEAASLLRRGEVVAFPTETVYGLGASARMDEAVEAVFTAKGRPVDNPLIVHLAEAEDVDTWTTSVSEEARQLIRMFWPGPLTLILPHNGLFSENVTAGLSTVGLRMPDHPSALALIRASGEPLAAPSANRSGRPSPTTAQHVYDDLHGRIAGIVDGGATGVGLESTVLDCSGPVPVLLRPGGVTQAELESVVGPIDVDPSLFVTGDVQDPKSPGMKYRHYAPESPLTLVEGSAAFFHSCIRAHQRAGERVGVIVPASMAATPADEVYVLDGDEPEDTARGLYSALRTFKQDRIDHIFMRTLDPEDIGSAVMNRLIKASGGRIRRETEEQ